MSGTAPKIKEVTFRPTHHKYGNQEAYVLLEDEDGLAVGVTTAFVWFDDELTFREEELVGLTLEQAQDLKQQRDIAYLRS